MSSVPSDSPILFELPEVPDFSLELAALARGLKRIAGLDEAGRGPLAGPVVAAAVAFEAGCIPDGLNDSKKLTRERREELFEVILACGDVSIASAGPARIDRDNIRAASLDAMRRALAGLPERPCHGLFDGRDVPPGIACTGDAIVKGDQRSLSIAAASIVAKVMRDRMMARLHLSYPDYGFALHAGYATEVHRQAIALVGPCPLHRRSFRPFRADGE
jgi:ribonuclease HII